jgi:hypothetical protein
MRLIATDYDQRGQQVAQRHINPPSYLLTMVQLIELQAGREVTVVSRRGRTDYRWQDAPPSHVQPSFLAGARS